MTRKRYRLGQGGEVRPQGGDLRARVWFLDAVSRLVPEALADLKSIAGDDDAAIRSWCTRWRLEAHRSSDPHWPRLTVKRTLAYLRVKDAERPSAPDKFVTVFSYWNTPETITWHPELETAEALRARVEKMIAASGTRADLLPAATIRPAAGTDPRRPFEWLALYQCGGLSYEQIAGRYENDEPIVFRETVRMAVQELGPLVGLALRPSTRGRPKKKPRSKKRKQNPSS